MEHAPCLGSYLGHGRARRIVDHDVEMREVDRGLEELLPLVVADVCSTDVLEAHPGLGRKEPLGDLDLGHLEREEGDRRAVCRSIHGEVQCEGGLADTRTGADDDHLACTQAQKLLVDAGEARLDAQELLVLCRHLAELVVEVLHDSLERRIVALDVGVRRIEDEFLCLIDDFLRILGSIVGKGRDLRRGLDDLPERRVAAQDLCVVAPARQGKGVARELEQIGASADLRKLAFRLQVVGKRDRVDRLAPVKEVAHREEYRAVRRHIEVVRRELDKRILEHIRREQHGGEDRCLGSRILRHDGLGRKRRRLALAAVSGIVGHLLLLPWPGCSAGLSRSFPLPCRRLTQSLQKMVKASCPATCGFAGFQRFQQFVEDVLMRFSTNRTRVPSRRSGPHSEEFLSCPMGIYVQILSFPQVDCVFLRHLAKSALPRG